MCLIFLSVCVLKMGNRVREQGVSVRGGTRPTHFYSFSECECISVYSFVLSGFASVSVFRNWVFVIACGFAKIKVIF